jgi:hypothetical protein
VDDAPSNFDLQLIRRICKFLRNTLPVRFDSLHVCYNDRRLIPHFVMGTHSHLRFRAHYGSHDEECQCQLTSFGIPISALSVSPQGEFHLENHTTWMARQRAIEAKKSKGKGPALCVSPKAKEKPKNEKVWCLDSRLPKSTSSWQHFDQTNQTVMNQRGVEEEDN